MTHALVYAFLPLFTHEEGSGASEKVQPLMHRSLLTVRFATVGQNSITQPSHTSVTHFKARV